MANLQHGTQEQNRAWKRANPEKVRTSKRKYYISHRPQFYAYVKANQDRYHAYSKAWRERNPHKVALYRANRRAAKLRATPRWLTEDHWALIDMKYQLASYLTAQTGMPWEVDHIFPLQGKEACGLHVPWNMRVVPRFENRAKINR